MPWQALAVERGMRRWMSRGAWLPVARRGGRDASFLHRQNSGRLCATGCVVEQFEQGWEFA